MKTYRIARSYHFVVAVWESKRVRIRRREMWATALAILALLSASLALAEEFKTIKGQEYKDATVSRVEADGIVLRTKSGIVKLYFSELPKEVQERFDHDAAKTTAAATAHQTPTNDVKPSRFVAALEKLQRQDLLRIDCSERDARAWIAFATWRRCDAQEKENTTKNLAAYCHPQHPSIWILDKQSGRKLASYSPLRGAQGLLDGGKCHASHPESNTGKSSLTISAKPVGVWAGLRPGLSWTNNMDCRRTSRRRRNQNFVQP
jgi:hypothetical protein